MSEYQFYEFQAVDRHLTDQEMNELRSFSTRADITPNRFVNEYSWGSFKGDEDLWMEKYFDEFLHYANWGTHILTLGLPAVFLDLEIAQTYCTNRNASVRLRNNRIILKFSSESEDGGEWEEGLKLSAFLGLRRDLIQGDLRCLYLGWLSGIQDEEYDEEEFEPPVPAGLAQLSPALIRFAEFLRIDPDLLEAASKVSPSLDQAAPSPEDLRIWLATLPSKERESLLSDIIEGSMKGDQTTAMSLSHRFNKMWNQRRTSQISEAKRRVLQLLNDTKNVSQERRRMSKLAREKQLNEMVGRESTIWDQIESLVSEKQAASYERAVELLVDLRDLAARGDSDPFQLKFAALRKKHSGKSLFINHCRRMEIKI